MQSKWKSRKLITAVGSVAVILLTNVGLPEPVAERITEALTWIVSAYLGAQGVVDVVSERSKK